VKWDFLAVNRILAATEAIAKRDFSTGFVGVIDWLFARVDDDFALWSIERARDAAWENTQHLWSLRPSRPSSDATWTSSTASSASQAAASCARSTRPRRSRS
jgi:hypothetical protein